MVTAITEKKPETYRDEKRTARIAGILFIVATAASLLGSSFLGSVNASNYLTLLSANSGSVSTGILFLLIGAFSSASIAISLYPVLRRYSQGLALGAVGFRLIEGALYIIGAIFVVLLLNVSRQFVTAGGSSLSQSLGATLLVGYNWVNFAAAPLVFALGASMYYLIFYRTKLVPRWLSGWGLAGTMLCISSSLLVMFNLLGAFSTPQIVLNLPIAVQEMALAVWLIVKGLRISTTN